MTEDSTRYRKVVERLDDALDYLEESLEPLFAKPMSETIASLSGSLDQAKLSVLVPYMVHDLLFIYLKTKGIDPKTHPVVAELERIKQYFAKIKQAEDPEKRRLAIDREAAGRFIKHAIAQARAEEKRDLASTSGAEQMDLDNAQVESSTAGGTKRRRPAVDPFAGYGETAEDAPAKRTKAASPAPAFKYTEQPSSVRTGKGKGKAPVVSPEAAQEHEDESDENAESDNSILEIIDGDPGSLVVEDANPNTDGSWTVVENAAKKSKERKAKLGFGGGKDKKSRSAKPRSKRPQ